MLHFSLNILSILSASSYLGSGPHLPLILFICNLIALTIFFWASSMVEPWEKHPGKAGTIT